MFIQLRALLNCILLLSISMTSFAGVQEKYNSGFQERTIPDPVRPLQIALWYPTLEQQPIEMIGENVIFQGENAIRNASLADYNHPLIIISHGFGGSWRNQVWLAGALSKYGYIVAAPNHPGTTTQNMDRKIAQNMLERPKDISRTITYLLSDENFSVTINPHKIGIVGHSYGGWTAIETIGGQFSATLFAQECQSYPSSASCKIYNQQMEGLAKDSNYFKLDRDMRDPRITAAFIFDLGLARGFTMTSLSKVTVPVFIVSAGDFDKSLPSEFESQYLAQYLPSQTTQYLPLNNATHFSFIGICKPNAIILLKEEEIDDSYICENDTNDREAIHQLLIDRIISYLD